MTATPVNLLPAIELETGNQPTHTILWMHGLGADGHDFVPIVDELALPSSYRVRFLFPHAPSRAVSINHGMVMPAWYDFDMAEPDAIPYEDAASLYDSQRSIEALIAREGRRGIRSGNIVLAGFSQGGYAMRKSLPASWHCRPTCLCHRRWRRRRIQPTLPHPFSWLTGKWTM